MARFRLLEKHYLNIDNVEYEHKEEVQGKVKGRNRQTRKVFPVPLYLDPKDEADCNYPGEIIIATKEDRLFPNDYLIRGEFVPTPDMEPLDAEADAIMTAFRASYRGEHAIESLSSSFGETLLDKFMKQIEALGGREANAVPGGAVSLAEFEKVKAENASLSAKLDEVLARLNAMAKPSESAPSRRGI